MYPKVFVAGVAKELAEARQVVAQGLAPDGEAYVQRIHERFTYRMHDLAEFMKTLLQRLCCLASDAAVGSRGFVDGLFEQCRERFGSKRKSGARKMRGRAAAGGMAGLLWSARDLRLGIE